MKKTAKFHLDKKVISQWESDLRRMTKIYRSIPTDPARTWKYGEMFDNPDYEKNLQAWEEARKLFSRYERNIQDLVYDEILPGPEKEKTWQERALREKAWGFITDIRSSSLFDRSYHYLTDKHEPDLPKLGKVRDTNVRRYQKSAREFFEALEDWLALKGGSHVSNRIEQMNLAGFQVRLYDATGSERNIAFVKAGLEKYRERAQAYAPILIQNQVPINIYPNKSHGDAEASYDWGTKTISLWEWATISSRNINRLVWVLAHEMGHHVFKTALNNSQRDLWERVIKGDYKDLDLREVIKKMRSGEDISDFIQRIKNEDPILQLQLETLWYNPSVKDLELFSIRDIVEYLEKGGNPMVRVPTTPITQYAAKNPEEAFCEAIGVLVGLGPRGLHEKVRALLRIMIPSIRIATQKGEVRTILASTNEPTDPKLWDKVQALTKGEIKSLRHDGKTIQGPNDGKGFRIFPSAYANGWSSKIYKDLGGKWRKSKTARGEAKKDVGQGGLDEWFSGHGGDEGDATWGDWVAITPIKHKVDDKTYEPGDIVGPCGISSDAAWKEITNNGKDPLKCMPRNKAHDMPKENRAELAKEKQKAEEEGSNRGKKPTNTPTFSEEADELLEKSARMKRADSRSDAEKDAIFSKWKDLINMTEKELNSWAKDPNRLEASLSRDEAEDLSKSKKDKIQSGYDSLHRIKRRVSKPQQEWSDEDYDNAAQENGFNQRMIGNKPGDPIGDTGMAKWEISLRNWGHDPSKASSPAHSKWKSWSRKNKLKMASTSRDSMRNNVAGNRSILTTHAGSNMNLSKIAQRVAAKKLENNLSRPVIKKINAAIDKAGLTGRLMFPGSRAGWAKVFEVLGDFGVTTDTIPYISGPSGDIRIFLRWINDEESEIDNTVLVFTWHKQQSEKYEILAYLS